MTHDDEGPWWETLRTPEEWALISANEQMWFQPVPSDETVERLQVAHEMGLVVQGFMLASLTQRQQQVVTLYCLEGLTQVEVAASLGISQASVSQHLKGKLRGGCHPVLTFFYASQHVAGCFFINLVINIIHEMIQVSSGGAII